MRFDHLTIATPEDLIRFHEVVCAQARELLGPKNHDYAGYAAQGEEVDTFQNLRRHGEYGICVRLSDKLARLENQARGGKLLVTSETVEDTCLDLINYAVFLLGYGREVRTLRERARKLRHDPKEDRDRLEEIIQRFQLGDHSFEAAQELRAFFEAASCESFEEGVTSKVLPLKRLRVVRWGINYHALDEEGFLILTPHQTGGTNCVVVAELTGSFSDEQIRNIQFGVGNPQIEQPRLKEGM